MGKKKSGFPSLADVDDAIQGGMQQWNDQAVEYTTKERQEAVEGIIEGSRESLDDYLGWTFVDFDMDPAEGRGDDGRPFDSRDLAMCLGWITAQLQFARTFSTSAADRKSCGDMDDEVNELLGKLRQHARAGTDPSALWADLEASDDEEDED